MLAKMEYPAVLGIRVGIVFKLVGFGNVKDRWTNDLMFVQGTEVSLN